MEKTITIDGAAVPFKATASTPRRYRAVFGRDMLKDMNHLQEVAQKEESLSSESLEIFENIAYIMAKQANPDIPATADDWLDTFSMFSIYEVLPQIIQLWKVENLTTVEAKKKVVKQNGR